jgi:hypothetical protein
MLETMSRCFSDFSSMLSDRAFSSVLNMLNALYEAQSKSSVEKTRLSPHELL